MAKLTIQRSKFNAFKKYLEKRHIPYRPGKNDKQKLQIQYGRGWAPIYYNKKYVGQYTAPESLRTLIYAFLKQEGENVKSSQDSNMDYSRDNSKKFSAKNAVAHTVQEKLKDGTYRVSWVAADMFRITKA